MSVNRKLRFSMLELTPLFHTTADALDAGLVIVDTTSQVLYLNAEAERLLEVAARDATGRNLVVLLRDYQADALVRQVLETAERQDSTIQPVFSGRTLRLRCLPIAGRDDPGLVTGALLLIRDLTQLSQLERSRRDMVANVSHELRTPLASLKLLVETLQSDPPPEVAQRMLGQVAEEVDAINQLVDELHELSQIESGRISLKLQPAALGPVLARALSRIRPQAERKELQVVAEASDTLPPALIDTERIGQVLINLLHNAIKFTAPGGTVAARALAVDVEEQRPTVGVVRGPAPSHDDQMPLPEAFSPGLYLVVEVRDTGIGIPEQELPRIFERFYKVDRARTRNSGGTGLGLAIAKHLIEGHGGTLWATSQEGIGSSFFFALPAA
jgi:two-component system, OmpR family, phosphate regulon sensor histidine kinase PhoR